MTPKIGIAFLTASSLLTLHAPAQAQTDVRNSHITQVADGENCGRTRRDENGREREGDNYQACAEHATLAQLADQKSIVMFRLASKDVLNGVEIFDRAQLACTSITVTPEGPVVNVDKFVTRNDGNQYRNAHASNAVAIDQGKAVAVFYNYRPNNPNNTQRYAQVFDAQCNSLSDQTLVMAKNNDDVCASLENYSHLPTIDQDGDTRVVATCGGNGNGRDDGWAYETRFVRQADGSYDIDKTWDLSIEPDEERTRGTGTYIADQNLFAVCMSAGDDQPTDKGVRCYGVDTGIDGEQGSDADSRLLWRQYVARRDGRIYQTQIKLAPSAAVADEATATWQTLVKRNRRGKGSATLNTVRLKFSRAGMEIVALPVLGAAPGQDATHRAMIAAPWGIHGAALDTVMLVSSSINGSPNAMATAQLLTWDANAKQFLRGRQIGLNSAIDNGWISNIYGNNPHNQGRNHIQSRVFENPYYGDAAGFLPKVKTFVATAATPRLMREGTSIAQDKLAFQLVLTPAVVAPDVVEEPEPTEPLTPEEPADQDNDGANDLDGTDSGDLPVEEEDDSMVGTKSDLGGCSVASTQTSLGTLAFLAFAVLLGNRRRRHQS